MDKDKAHDFAAVEAQLKATQAKLAESILQRDLAIRLLRRQTLANVQLQRQIAISWRMSKAIQSWRFHQILYYRLRRVAPKPLKLFIKRHFLGIKS